jgi:hypothetical protein
MSRIGNKMNQFGRDFAILEEMITAADRSSELPDEDREDLLRNWWDMIHAATNTRARTSADRAEKAKMLIAVHRLISPTPSPFIDLAMSIAQDLKEDIT